MVLGVGGGITEEEDELEERAENRTHDAAAKEERPSGNKKRKERKERTIREISELYSKELDNFHWEVNSVCQSNTKATSLQQSVKEEL